MRSILAAIALAAMLSSCAGSAANRATVALGAACDAFATTLATLTPLRRAGRLSFDAVERINSINREIDPICQTGSIVDPGTSIGAVEVAIRNLQSIR